MLQYAVGGVIAFVTAEECEKLLVFYRQNHFKLFDKRAYVVPSEDQYELVQLMRIIK